MTDGRDDYDVKRCGKCAAWIPTSATMCAYCGTTRPDEAPARPRGGAFSLRHGIRVTDVLIGLNCAYLLFAVLAEYARTRSGNPIQWILNATGFDVGMWRAGAYAHEDFAGGQWWRVVTATFLHAGIIHIAVNMWSLRELGRLAEDLFGPAKFLAVYIVSGVSSALAISVWYVWILKRPPDLSHTPMLVGASGAIFGVAGLLTVFLLRAGTQRARAIGMALARNVLFMLVLGWMIPFVSNTGHVGGLVVGVAFGLTVRDQFTARLDPASQRTWTQLAALLAAVAVAALLVGGWFAVTYRGEFR